VNAVIFWLKAKALMNCDWVRENIPLYLYDELADDARHELEGHIGRCSHCAAELEALRVFHGEMSALPQLEVTPNLLASARIQLSGALENVQLRRGWRWAMDPMAMLRQFRFSPALASVIFLIGFGGGLGTMYRMSTAMHAAPASGEQQEASIADIRNIVQDPSTGQVRIDYERALPATVQGSVNDPQIQALLVMAELGPAHGFGGAAAAQAGRSGGAREPDLLAALGQQSRRAAEG
jgi:hypothetical protein